MMLYFYHRRYSFTAAEFFPLDLTILLPVRLVFEIWEDTQFPELGKLLFKNNLFFIDLLSVQVEKEICYYDSYIPVITYHYSLILKNNHYHYFFK